MNDETPNVTIATLKYLYQRNDTWQTDLMIRYSAYDIGCSCAYLAYLLINEQVHSSQECDWETWTSRPLPILRNIISVIWAFRKHKIYPLELDRTLAKILGPLSTHIKIKTDQENVVKTEGGSPPKEANMQENQPQSNTPVATAENDHQTPQINNSQLNNGHVPPPHEVHGRDEQANSRPLGWNNIEFTNKPEIHHTSNGWTTWRSNGHPPRSDPRIPHQYPQQQFTSVWDEPHIQDVRELDYEGDSQHTQDTSMRHEDSSEMPRPDGTPLSSVKYYNTGPRPRSSDTRASSSYHRPLSSGMRHSNGSQGIHSPDTRLYSRHPPQQHVSEYQRQLNLNRIKAEQQAAGYKRFNMPPTSSLPMMSDDRFTSHSRLQQHSEIRSHSGLHHPTPAASINGDVPPPSSSSLPMAPSSEAIVPDVDGDKEEGEL